MDSFGDASDSFGDLGANDRPKVNPFSYRDSFADNSDEYAEVPAKYDMPKAFDDNSKKRNFEDLQVFDVDEYTSISLENSEDNADPDPAFEINMAAAHLYKKRRSELKLEKKKISILQLQAQESKRQRLLQLKAKNPKVLSKSEKAAVQLIERKEAGEPVDQLYLKDTESVITIVCESYTQDKIEELLGKNEEWDHCFGCSFAVGSVKMEESPLTALNTFISQIWGGGEAEIESILISHFYETKIRTPYNKNYKGYGKPLPPWSSRHIFECLSYHRIVGHNELWRTTTLRGLCNDQKHLERTKYAYPSYIAEKNLEPSQKDFFISPEKHKMHMDIIRAQILVRKAKFDGKPTVSGVNAPIHFRDHNATVISAKANLLAGTTHTKMNDWTKVKKGI